MFAAHVVGHQRTQQRDKVGILHHPRQSLLELFGLNTAKFKAREFEAHEDVGKELAMGIVGMEDNTLLRGLSQFQNGTGHLIDGREFETLVEGFIRHHSDDHVGTQRR